MAVGFIFHFSPRIVKMIFPHPTPQQEWIAHEFSRKCFHIVGGTIIAMSYHFGVKNGTYSSSWLFAPEISDAPKEWWKGFLPWVIGTWAFDAVRLCVPSISKRLYEAYPSVVRKKEMHRPTGMSFFLPGVLIASLVFPKDLALLGIMYLTCGDAAAGLGSAMGKRTIRGSDRKVEGSIACFFVTFVLGLFLFPAHPLSEYAAFIGAVVTTFAELTAELSGVDDNIVIPVCGAAGALIGMRRLYSACGVPA
jgi:dolichol kinase